MKPAAATSSGTTDRSPNLLVLSDVHLGADLQEGRYRLLRRLVQLDHDLVAFFDHYASRREDGRPWRIVFGGDLVDFMNVHIHPTATEREDLRARAVALREDADAAEGEVVRRKLVRVIARHQPAFAALARFVGAGHEVVIVHGNHDAEFYWPEVRAELLSRLGAIAAVEWNVSEGEALERVKAAVSFTPWFYYEPGLVYVEHGHQYDEFCSFDHLLAPVDDTGGRVADNMATVATRRVTLNVPGFIGEETRHWTLFDYVRWLWRLGGRRTARVASLYFLLVGSLGRLWWDTVRGRLRAARGIHRRNLRAFAERVKLPFDTVLELDALRERPVQWSLPRLMGIVLFDGVVLLAAGAGLALGAFTRVPGSGWSTPLGLLAAATLGFAVARLTRKGYTDGGDRQHPRAERIRDLLKVPFVVMGHSHLPRVTDLAGGGLFFNTGSWVEGTPMHVRIRRGGETPHAELLPWHAQQA